MKPKRIFGQEAPLLHASRPIDAEIEPPPTACVVEKQIAGCMLA